MLSRECVLECGYERFKSAEGGADEDKIFDYINVTLKDRMPTGVNASALCQNIKDHFANPDEVFF